LDDPSGSYISTLLCTLLSPFSISIAIMVTASFVTRIFAIAGMLMGAQLAWAAPVALLESPTDALASRQVNIDAGLYKRIDLIGAIQFAHEKKMIA